MFIWPSHAINFALHSCIYNGLTVRQHQKGKLHNSFIDMTEKHCQNGAIQMEAIISCMLDYRIIMWDFFKQYFWSWVDTHVIQQFFMCTNVLVLMYQLLPFTLCICSEWNSSLTEFQLLDYLCNTYQGCSCISHNCKTITWLSSYVYCVVI